MPQFDFANFAPQIAWLALFFAILYFVIVRATVPRLARVIDERDGKVTGDIAAAETAKSDADRIHDAYVAAMADAHARAHASVAEAKAASIRDAEAKINEADDAVSRRTHDAMTRLELARASAEVEIERIAADAAADIVAALGGARPDGDTAHRAAREALAA